MEVQSAQREHIAPEAQQEQLRIWKERGLTDEAIGVYGTSQEFLDRCLQTGYIPSQINDQSKRFHGYLQELGVDGNHVYFSYPFVDKVAKDRPDFASRLESKYFSQTDAVFNKAVSNKALRQSARTYAQRNAFMHYFSKMTGFSYQEDGFDDSIIVLANELTPDKLEDTFELFREMNILVDLTERDPSANANQQLMEQIKARIPPEQLKKNPIRNTGSTGCSTLL